MLIALTTGSPAGAEPGTRLVEVQAVVDAARVTAGGSIPIRLTIRNGTPWQLHYCPYQLEGAPMNGETLGVTVVGVSRWVSRASGLMKPLEVTPPEVGLLNRSPPPFRIAPGEAISLRTDLAKWKVEGGWIAGDYAVRLSTACLSAAHDPQTQLVARANQLLVRIE